MASLEITGRVITWLLISSTTEECLPTPKPHHTNFSNLIANRRWRLWMLCKLFGNVTLSNLPYRRPPTCQCNRQCWHIGTTHVSHHRHTETPNMISANHSAVAHCWNSESLYSLRRHPSTTHWDRDDIRQPLLPAMVRHHRRTPRFHSETPMRPSK